MYPLYTLAFAAAVTGYAPVAVLRQIVRGVPVNLRERLGLPLAHRVGIGIYLLDYTKGIIERFNAEIGRAHV